MCEIRFIQPMFARKNPGPYRYHQFSTPIGLMVKEVDGTLDCIKKSACIESKIEHSTVVWVPENDHRDSIR